MTQNILVVKGHTSDQQGFRVYYMSIDSQTASKVISLNYIFGLFRKLVAMSVNTKISTKDRLLDL